MKRAINADTKHGKHRKVNCEECGKPISCNKLKKHMLTHNEKKLCSYCKKDIRSDQLTKHELLCQSKVNELLCDRTAGVSEHLDHDEDCTSISGYYKSFNLDIPESNDYDQIISDSCESARPRLLQTLQKHPVKAQIVIGLSFYQEVEGEREYQEKVFRSICEPIMVEDDLADFFPRVKAYIRAGIDEYVRHGSGWIFDQFYSAKLEIAKYSPLSASGTIDIPQKIKDMKSVLNIQSPDNKCFLYCLLAKLFPVASHSERYTKYLENEKKINTGKVQFPVKVSDICKIEQLNHLSISVFEWSLEDRCVYPLKHGSGIGEQIDLLYIQDDDTAHYMLIKNFNAFMRHRTKYHHTMFYCRKCLHGFTKEDNQKSHSVRCNQGINQIIKMPESGVIKFEAEHKQDKKLFALYFDFECLTVPYNEGAPPKNSKPKKSSTDKYQKHIPCSFCIVTKSEFEEYEEKTLVYSNEDPDNVVKTFVEELGRIHNDMMICYAKNQHPIHMTKEDEEKFKKSTHCHICKKALDWNSKKNYPVRDHNHLEKKNNFRGAAHNICNWNFFNRTKKIPAFAHNLKNYDLNIFLRDLIKTTSTEGLSVIPENLEKFKAVFTEQFIFLDSFAFLSTSLDNLAEDLKNSGVVNFTRLRKEFPNHYDLLVNKGVYFYDYASSFAVFSEEHLPPKEAFFNKLRDEHITHKDYLRAKTVFETMKCKNLRDYMELYVKTDTIILCDVFENFRNLGMDYYGLDACHYMSLPAFSWDSMLKMTGVELELMTSIDMYTFVEQNLRGGVTTVNHRHHRANNPYLSDYNPSEPCSYIRYIDANNLYGASMSQKLPTKGYRWLDQKEINQLDILNIDPEGDFCYIIEVDLDYPEELHDSHSDFPLAVEKKMIKQDQLSAFNLKFLEKNKEKFKSSMKLCPDLHNKRNFVCSLKNLQFCVGKGLQLKKIHRVMVAEQSNFMQSYIDFNSAKRQASKSKFEQDFFKLANNSVYGKFIEGLRNRTDVHIVNDERKAKRLTSKPQFRAFQILDEDVTIVQCTKRQLTLNKPIACGFIVLENSKYIMTNFWYDVLKPRYGSDIKLLLSDTDSFIYSVYTEDSYRDLYELREYMDLASYDEKTYLGQFKDVTNKKVPGKFSDEKPTEIIKEVISLKPKMYSVLTEKLVCKKVHECEEACFQDAEICSKTHECIKSCFVGHKVTAKGITKTAQKKITHEDYREVLEKQSTTMTSSRTIRSFNHNLYSISINKRGLSSFDDKKYILDDGISTLSYGHYKI